MRISRMSFLGLLIAVFGLVLVGCTANGPKELLDTYLPDYVLNAPPDVRKAYDYAVKHPDELAKYPCYCGCGAMGHTSNLSCYVKRIEPGGTVEYDNHGAGCGICVDITKDVMRLKAEGKSSPDIRRYIDAKYSPFGPATDTEFPKE